MSVSQDLERPRPAAEFRGTVISMSLRDWFAGQALPLLLAECGTYTQAPKIAYEIADAMLRERQFTKECGPGQAVGG